MREPVGCGHEIGQTSKTIHRVLTPSLCRMLSAQTYRGTLGSFSWYARAGMARAVAKQGFTMIPDDIAHRTDISPLAKTIYGFIVRRARNDRLSLGARFLAEFWGSSKSRVAYALTRLEEVGLIGVERTGTGKRYTYKVLQYHNKASNSGTLSGEETGHWRDTPATGGTEAATGGTRKRLETSETNTYMQPSSENEAEGRTPPRGPGVAPAADVNGELHRAVVAAFYPSRVPDTRIDAVRSYVWALARLSATPAEVLPRKRRWKELGYTYPCTLKTLVEHWDELAPPEPNPYDPYDGPAPPRAEE